MPPRLIVNADDFGLTHGINRAIEELYIAGGLSSATLMANGPAFAGAVAIAKRHPGLGVGCHLVLTDGHPISPPATVPSLLGSDRGSFRPSLVGFGAAALSGAIKPDEVMREAIAQIERLQTAGIQVTHVDTHKHTHVLPTLARPLLEAARRTGVRAMRNPFEQPWSFDLGRGNRRRALQVALIRLLRRRFLASPAIQSGVIRTTDGTVGISATGNLTETSLSKVLQGMPEGVWELVCHPGYNDSDLHRVRTRLRESRDVERRALLSLIAGRASSLREGGSPETLRRWDLIHFGHLPEAHRSPF